MIEYFEQLTQEEQEDLTDVIRLLYRQTFLLTKMMVILQTLIPLKMKKN